MRDSRLFYTPSNGFSPLIVLAPLIVLPVAMICALVYDLLLAYARFFVVLTLVWWIGYVVSVAGLQWGLIRVMKIRSRAVSVLLGLFVGLASMYCCWSIFCYILLAKANVEVSFLDVMLRPDLTARFANALSEEGWFTISRRFSKGDAVSGIALWAVWAIEGAFILGAPIFTAFTFKGMFCERCNRWLEEKDGLARMHLWTFEEIQGDIESRGIQAVLAAPYKEPDPSAFCELNGKVCTSCKQIYGVSFVTNTVEVNKKGEEEKKTTTVISNLLVSAEEFEAVQHLGQHAPAQEEPRADYPSERRSIAMPRREASAEDETSDLA